MCGERAGPHLPSSSAHQPSISLPGLPSPCHPPHRTKQPRRGGTRVHATGVHRPGPFPEALCWVSQRQRPLSPGGQPRGPPVPFPCSKHLTFGLRAFPPGTCAPSSAWLPGWPADHRARWHVCFGQHSPPCELRREAEQQGSPLLLLPPDQGCCRRQAVEQSPAWAAFLAKPARCWVLPRIHPGRAIRVTPLFSCPKTPKSCRFFFLGDATRSLLAQGSCPRHPRGPPSPISRTGRAQAPLAGQPGRAKAAQINIILWA